MLEKEKINGEVSEWPKEHAWKACMHENVSWVRIPPSPIVKEDRNPSHLLRIFNSKEMKDENSEFF